MRIKSNILNSGDLFLEAPAKCDVDIVNTSAGYYKVSLSCSTGRRWKNTGRWGASHVKAATREQWGWYIAALYVLDPDAVIGEYRGYHDFHTKTGGKFSGGMGY